LNDSATKKAPANKRGLFFSRQRPDDRLGVPYAFNQMVRLRQRQDCGSLLSAPQKFYGATGDVFPHFFCRKFLHLQLRIN